MTGASPQRLYFIYGPPGSGKTSLAERLAALLDLPFIDLDEHAFQAFVEVQPI